MKKFLMFILFAVLIISCEPVTVETSIGDKNEFTTVQMQELPKDTVIISFDDNKIYFFDETNKVYLQAKISNDTSAIIEIGELLAVLIAFGIGGLMLGIYLSFR